MTFVMMRDEVTKTYTVMWMNEGSKFPSDHGGMVLAKLPIRLGNTVRVECVGEVMVHQLAVETGTYKTCRIISI